MTNAAQSTDDSNKKPSAGSPDHIPEGTFDDREFDVKKPDATEISSGSNGS